MRISLRQTVVITRAQLKPVYKPIYKHPSTHKKGLYKYVCAELNYHHGWDGIRVIPSHMLIKLTAMYYPIE